MPGTSPDQDDDRGDQGDRDAAERDSRATNTDTPDTETAETGSRDAPAPETAERRTYSPALLATAVALPIALVAGVVVAAVMIRNDPVEREPLALGPVPAPAAEGPACGQLLPTLPAELGDEYTRSTLVEPAPPATVAWQRPEGGEPVVLRCGLDRPLEFHRASPLQVVNGVQWFEVREETAQTATWFAVDRATYLALTVPDESGPTPVQVVSDTVTAQLPAQPIDPGELPG